MCFSIIAVLYFPLFHAIESASLYASSGYTPYILSIYPFHYCCIYGVFFSMLWYKLLGIMPVGLCLFSLWLCHFVLALLRLAVVF